MQNGWNIAGIDALCSEKVVEKLEDDQVNGRKSVFSACSLKPYHVSNSFDRFILNKTAENHVWS